jgi:D-3-phosphoglycerate dehydrogenase
LPNTYPIGEQDEDAEAKAKRHGKLRILLLENINVDASDFLKKQGYEVSCILLSGFGYGEAAK